MEMIRENIPGVSVQDVLNCSLPMWYPRFEKHTLKSIIIPLSQEVLEYFRSDEFYLPESANKIMDEMRVGHDLKPSDNADTDEDNWSNEDDDDSSRKKINFPDLEKRITDAIEKYEAVFPKLNWSSPRDVRWMISDTRLKCTNLADIFLLLKSSDFITHDLCEPFKFCRDETEHSLSEIEYVLVLKRWSALQPSKEFRCFVQDNQIIAISQRDCENYYEFMSSNANQIVDDLLEFFKKHIQDQFFSADFVVDIYRKESDKLYIIDFNPWGPMTDTLLFQWPEILALSSNNLIKRPEFRYIQSQNGIKNNSYAQYAIPKDIADIARNPDVNKMTEIMATQKQMQEDESDDD